MSHNSIIVIAGKTGVSSLTKQDLSSYGHYLTPLIFMFYVEGDHTLSKTVVTSSGKSSGMLSRFTTKKATCIGCRAVLDNSGK